MGLTLVRPCNTGIRKRVSVEFCLYSSRTLHTNSGDGTAAKGERSQREKEKILKEIHFSKRFQASLALGGWVILTSLCEDVEHSHEQNLTSRGAILNQIKQFRRIHSNTANLMGIL